MKTHSNKSPASRAIAPTTHTGTANSGLSTNRSPVAQRQRQSLANIATSPRQIAQRQAVQVAPRASRKTAIKAGPSILQRIEDSPGLKAVKKELDGKPTESEADFTALCAKGETRMGLLAHNGQHGQASSSPRITSGNAPLRIREMKKENGMTITSDGSLLPGKDEGRYAYSVKSEICNQTHRIATYSNSFFLDTNYNIIGMVAGDNYRSKDPNERQGTNGSFEFYMSEVVDLQYQMVNAAVAKYKAKLFKAFSKPEASSVTDAALLDSATRKPIQLPFEITRTPTPTTQLGKALIYAKNKKKTPEEINRVLLGSEHGSMIFNMCKSENIPLEKLSITFINNKVTFKINL